MAVALPNVNRERRTRLVVNPMRAISSGFAARCDSLARRAEHCRLGRIRAV